ncbi:MAG TPA: molybdate ABC transporter substrate-binding protein [Rhodothermales bacterium]|nr:molybdate ABC transporter substrate-binding protein [Rhodothermales bacterium]
MLCPFLIVFLLMLLTGCHASSSPETKDVVVFAAASLTDALQAVADSFERAYPQYRVVPNVAATSLLARQIEQGAPADVFFSANLAWMDKVEAQGHVGGAVQYPLSNRLVVVARRDSTSMAWASLEPLVDQPRIALADPEHVPAGIYAREGLVCAGLWDQMAPQVVPTLNVRAALLSVRNGAATVAVVYASDVQADALVQVVARWPEACQPDIRYAVARLADAPNPDGAAAFVAFASDASRADLWEQYGFRPRLSSSINDQP